MRVKKMGKMKAYWMDSCEKVLEQFELRNITHGEALEELERLNAPLHDIRALKTLLKDNK